MRRALMGLAALAITAGGVSAAVPTAAQKSEFYDVCVGISGNDVLCTCKADAAMTLIDERMMGYVIAGMQGAGNAPEDVQRDWNNYVAQSNAVCKPNY